MAIDDADFQAIVAACDEAMGRRLEEVYLAIENLRGEMQATVGVLDGNDRALIGELQRYKQVPAAVVLAEAAESWERFVRSEAGHLGLKVLVAKTTKKAGGDGE